VLALLNEEQQMLKDLARQVAGSVAVAHPGDLATVERAKGWGALADAGLLGLRVRGADGSPQASGVEVALVAEALGAALAPLPYVGTVVALEALAAAGAPAAWIDEIAAGTARYGLLLTADLSGLAQVDDPSAVAFDVDAAAWALALGGSRGAPTLARVGLGPGFAAAASADLTRTMARAGAVPAGIEDSGVTLAGPALESWLALALATAAADLVGVMASALARAVDYSKERVQYGVKIGSFQAIQHLCADALVQIEAAGATTRYAAWAVDALDAGEALLAARTAKAAASEVARGVTETVMQVFGGIGQTWEHVAHLHTRRALVDRELLGNEAEQLLRIADARLGPA
jgi:alkylation response protein AidB-like acyl-CoA dehydrogenase